MKNKIYDVILFVGGAFIFTISLTRGIQSDNPNIITFSYRPFFSDEAIIGMSIGISMIVFGFLRRSWNKKEKS